MHILVVASFLCVYVSIGMSVPPLHRESIDSLIILYFSPGAYGAAVLYRKKDDGSHVILKEINLMELTKTERYSAMNEAQILSRLDHPNIISYYDNFEEDGVLMIEMEYADGG